MVKKKKSVKLALVASGSGTDADSIMKAWKAGQIPEVDEIVLISTKKDVDCLEKAKQLAVPTRVTLGKGKNFAQEFGKDLFEQRVDLVFLVGCIAIVPLVAGVAMYNIHPAHNKKHGGQGMYGVGVHRHVLESHLDKVRRGWLPDDGRFFTRITVQEVHREADKGRSFLMHEVEIPENIMCRLIAGTLRLGLASEMLQRHVLPKEWKLLPLAVSLAAQKILDAR